MGFAMAQKSKETSVKRLLRGIVISDKMDKTVVVKTIEVYKHSRFHKYLRREKCYKVHDAGSRAKVGDTVEFYEGKPVAKTKFMYLDQIILHAKGTQGGGA